MMLQFYVAGAGAGLLTSILDLVKVKQNGTIRRTGQALQEAFSTDFPISENVIAIILVVLVSVFLCWIFEVASRFDAFLRGCTVLAAFSIGSPNPIINQQEPRLLSVYASDQNQLQFVSTAWAQVAKADEQQLASIGEAYIVLKHLKTVGPITSCLKAPCSDASPLPETIFSVMDAQTRRRIALNSTTNYRLVVRQNYGAYVVQVDTPGYASITFNLTINKPLAAFDVTAPESRIPIALQSLRRPTKIDLQPNKSETYKMEGRVKRLRKDFDGAIQNYEQALKLDPEDGETVNFLGFAYFRKGNFDEAYKRLVVVVKRHPEYVGARINLLKVLCKQKKWEDAHSYFDDDLRPYRENWEDDGEFTRVCKALINSNY